MLFLYFSVFGLNFQLCKKLYIFLQITNLNCFVLLQISVIRSFLILSFLVFIIILGVQIFQFLLRFEYITCSFFYLLNKYQATYILLNFRLSRDLNLYNCMIKRHCLVRNKFKSEWVIQELIIFSKNNNGMSNNGYLRRSFKKLK